MRAVEKRKEREKDRCGDLANTLLLLPFWYDYNYVYVGGGGGGGEGAEKGFILFCFQC